MMSVVKNLAIYIGIVFVVSSILTAVEIPFLRKLHAGQSIREDGPQAHMKKSGTPTMGGLSFIIAICSVAIITCPTKNMLLICGSMLAYGVIGFVDDYIKVVKKRNLGLTAIQKIILQVLVAIAVAVVTGIESTRIYIPFSKYFVDFKWLYYPFVVFVMVAMTNAVNLTDGLDGLASSVTAVVACSFAIYFKGESAIYAAALCGGCLGFLLFNRHPAKLFMGDTGSLALGGGLAACAIVSGYEFALPIAGGIYVLEALSVIIQVFVFKTQHGRRFFRMAPIHHHFELGGWSEVKVVLIFVLVTIVLSAAAYVSIVQFAVK